MLNKLTKTLLNSLKYLPPEQIAMVERAIRTAGAAHHGQKRESGEEYLSHPLRVALILADLELDGNSICAAILHDVIEKSKAETKFIKKEFSATVANLVDGVTKLGKIQLKKSWLPFVKPKKEELREFERQTETLRKMFMAMSKDIRVVLIKIADRLDNMRTIEALEKEKRLRVARETQEIYAPLAYRLGMGEFKGMLEDLTFPILLPQEYRWAKELAIPEMSSRRKYLEKVKRMIEDDLSRAGIYAEIHIRAKHWYSLYKKLLKHDRDLSKIYDLIALRITVPTIEDCYNVLGIIHSRWKPLPGRIKDYIALPKPNGYQSLHTTVFCLGGKITEFQIRTEEMHYQAEFGVAAHWHYAEQKKSIKLPKSKLIWVQELARWQERLANLDDLKEGLEIDFFRDRIFVFTPLGDVKDLPVGATAVDFAYCIHTDIGSHCAGAKINGKMVQLNRQLQNGDMVEILTSKRAKPHSDWLSFAKTALARGCIRKALRAAT